VRRSIIHPRVFFLRILSVLAVTSSTVSILIGVRLAIGKHTAERRRLLVSMHISSGIVLAIVSYLLAFWAFTEPID